MSKLSNIKKCHVCGCIDLTPRYNIPIVDVITDEETFRDILHCQDCDTIHYIDDNGTISYEFSIKTNKTIERIIKKDKQIIYE